MWKNADRVRKKDVEDGMQPRSWLTFGRTSEKMWPEVAPQPHRASSATKQVLRSERIFPLGEGAGPEPADRCLLKGAGRG